MVRILCVPDPIVREDTCGGCGATALHIRARYFMRGERGELISGTAARAEPHRAPCGRQCGNSAPDARYRSGDDLHFPGMCSGVHPPSTGAAS